MLRLLRCTWLHSVYAVQNYASLRYACFAFAAPDKVWQSCAPLRFALLCFACFADLSFALLCSADPVSAQLGQACFATLVIAPLGHTGLRSALASPRYACFAGLCSASLGTAWLGNALISYALPALFCYAQPALC
jgi:hypothetical protein